MTIPSFVIVEVRTEVHALWLIFMSYVPIIVANPTCTVIMTFLCITAT